jgi:predicted metal-dependent hydrolase
MHTLPYELIRSRKRRRTISLHIKEGGRIVVYAPFRTPLSEIEALIERKRSWISEKVLEKQRVVKPAEKEFVPGETFLYLGESYPLEIGDSLQQERPLTLSFGRFILRKSCVEKARFLFIDWYKEESRRTLSERADYYGPRLGLFPKGIRITGAQARWGSCSRDNRLCFSWRTGTHQGEESLCKVLDLSGVSHAGLQGASSLVEGARTILAALAGAHAGSDQSPAGRLKDRAFCNSGISLRRTLLDRLPANRANPFLLRTTLKFEKSMIILPS